MFANSLDPDEALQYVEPDLRSILFDSQIYVSKILGQRLHILLQFQNLF